MTEHVTTWLEAYHDGELDGRRLEQVQVHLADCEACRADLAELLALSALLAEAPAAEQGIPADRFAAQVNLRLPRRPEPPAWQRTLEWAWRLAPVGLVGAWAVLQAAFVVTGLVLIALQLDAGSVLPFDLPAPGRPLWLDGAWSWPQVGGLADIGQLVLATLGAGGPLGWGVMLNLAATLLVGLMYWSWMASWWARRHHRQA